MLGALLVVLAGSTTYAVLSVTGDAEVGTPERRLRDARVSVYVMHVGVEAFRLERGRLPEHLEELDEDSPSIEYARVGSGYRLQATVGDARVTYASGDDIAPFREAFYTLPRRSR